jgi:hypothetical protein
VSRKTFVPPVSGLDRAARSPWAVAERSTPTSQNIPPSRPATSSTSSYWRWEPPIHAPPVTLECSRTTVSRSSAWATPVSDAHGRQSLVRGPKAVNKLVANGEKRGRPPITRSRRSLSLLLCSRSPKSSPSRSLAAQLSLHLRREQNRASKAQVRAAATRHDSRRTAAADC